MRIRFLVHTGVDLPCAIDTSIARSTVTNCSALNLFFGMTKAPFQDHFLTSLGLKKPGQVTPSTGNIIAFPEVGGLHHRYERRAT
jgi:hypothetical protein